MDLDSALAKEKKERKKLRGFGRLSMDRVEDFQMISDANGFLDTNGPPQRKHKKFEMKLTRR